MGRVKGTDSLDKWFVPKRSNVYQALAFLAVLEKYPRYLNWSSSQDAITTKMRIDFGGLKNKTVKQQTSRTMKAMMKYLGFIEDDGKRIAITQVGKAFLDAHRGELVNKGHSLANPVKPLISTSDIWKEQMIKLRLTNIDQPKCEDIELYPFIEILKLLEKLGYIDKEEIAYLIFDTHTNKECQKVIKKITTFRTIKNTTRKKKIDDFKKTSFGKLSLVDAPTSSYFFALCEATGLVERYNQSVVNPGGNKTIPAIRIIPSKAREVSTIISNYSTPYIKIKHDEKNIWKNYYYNRGINKLEKRKIKNCTAKPIYVYINNLTKTMIAEQQFRIEPKSQEEMYFMDCFQYEMEVYDFSDVTPVIKKNVINALSTIDIKKTDFISTSKMSKKQIVEEIRELINKSGFTTRIDRQLKMYAKLSGASYPNDTRSYRGAYLEYYFSLLLEAAKKNKKIDSFEASSKVDAYNIPKTVSSKADFIVQVEAFDIVIETTLLRPNSTKKLGRAMETEINGAVHHMQDNEQSAKRVSRIARGLFSPSAVDSNTELYVQNLSAGMSVTSKCIDLESLTKLFGDGKRQDIIDFVK